MAASTRGAGRRRPVSPAGGPGRALGIVVGALLFAAMAALMVLAFRYVSDADRYAADFAAGIPDLSGVGSPFFGDAWWGSAVVVILFLGACELIAFAIVRRRRRLDGGPRRFGLSSLTWLTLGLFVLGTGIPVAIELAVAKAMQRPQARDAGRELAAVARECPALAAEVRAILDRGRPALADVAAMRAKARVVAESPVKGQECGS